MSSIKHLGIVTAAGLLRSTVAFDARNERSESESWKEAEKALQDWRAAMPGDNLRIVPLSRRSYDGWEAAKP